VKGKTVTRSVMDNTTHCECLMGTSCTFPRPMLHIQCHCATQSWICNKLSTQPTQHQQPESNL
jgi:hypothetical protein